MAEKDILAEAKEAFKDAVECESQNRTDMLADLRFARMGEQWPDDIKRQRERDGRPTLVINKLPAFGRQVVNDARQNRPCITVTGVDSQSDPKTAEVLSGLIKHIERQSCADVAYDTAIDFAVYGGIGYIAVNTDYADGESFDQELKIERVVNPFSVYGDADAESADGSDWKYAFQTVSGDKGELKKKYGKREISSWTGLGTGDETDDEDLRLARFWRVTQQKKTLVQLTNGGVITEDKLTEDFLALLAASGIGPGEQTREITVPKVSLYLLSDNEVIETTEWAGKYIPLIPVYGEEVWIESERRWKSLIRDAVDSQRAFNYWRSTATELVALQPKAPWLGPKGSFKTDAVKWATANTENHQYLEYDPIPNQPPPMRQPFAGMPAGALQEALNASDDMKSILGIYDASLGARSNETSGRAIMARQRESDVGTFHFVDNLTRSIRQVGKVLVDLIPKIYDTPRIVRIIGKEESVGQVPINQQYQAQDDNGQPYLALHDFGVGKYDVDVKAGPSYTTQRQEAATQMAELIRAAPELLSVAGDLLVKNLDWPGADELAKRLEKLVPGNEQNPQAMQQAMAAAQQQTEQAQQAMQQVQQGQQEIEQGKAEIDKGKAELEKLIAKLETKQANIAAAEAKLNAEVAKAQAALQGREMQLEVRGFQTDQRDAQLEAKAREQTGESMAAEIVQQAMQAVDQRIAGVEQIVAQQAQPKPPVRRRARSRREKNGELVVMIEELGDDGDTPVSARETRVQRGPDGALNLEI